MLKHQDAVAHGDAERAAGTAFAGDDDDDGRLEDGHVGEVLGNGLGLAASLGVKAGEGARGVDERDDGQVELLGQAHDAHGLAVTIGVGHAETVGNLLLGGAALAVTHEDDALAADVDQAGEHGGVVSHQAVAVQLVRLRVPGGEVVDEQGAIGVAGNLDGVPGGVGGGLLGGGGFSRGLLGSGLGRRFLSRRLGGGLLGGGLGGGLLGDRFLGGGHGASPPYLAAVRKRIVLAR